MGLEMGVERVQWTKSKRAVIREDKINSHGGSRRAGSQLVSRC